MILEQTFTQVDDVELARAARDDPQVFDILYRRYVADVYRYCYVQVNNQPDAEDLTAQTFLAALEGLPRFRGRGSFVAWLFGIARRKCADHHRQHYARQDNPFTLPATAEVDPEQQAYLGSVLDCLKYALKQLSPDRREALQLRFWGGLSVRETAKIMHRTQGAVKMLTSRAIADLKKRCLSHE